MTEKREYGVYKKGDIVKVRGWCAVPRLRGHEAVVLEARPHTLIVEFSHPSILSGPFILFRDEIDLVED